MDALKARAYPGRSWLKVNGPNLCQPRMPLAISTHIQVFGIILNAMNNGKRVTYHSQFFCESLERTLAANMCPDQPRAIK